MTEWERKIKDRKITVGVLGLGCKEDDLPVAERLCREVLSLPVYPELKQEQIEYVANTVLKFYGIN